MRGRPPKTRQQAAADGDTRKIGARKHEAMVTSGPVAEQGLPPCPDRMKGDAREAYEFWKDQLEKMNLAEMPDGKTLERAAVHYALANKADAKLEAEEEVIEVPIVSKKGELIGHKPVINPWVKIREKADTIFRQFASEFGLSPVSRTRLEVERNDSSGGDLGKVLSGPRAQRAPVTVN